MPDIELRFDIVETSAAVGRVIVNQEELAEYMAENDITTLTIDDLRGFMNGEIEVNELFQNITGQDWSGLRAGEDNADEVTIPLYQEPVPANT
jgi:hypothetical protein